MRRSPCLTAGRAARVAGMVFVLGALLAACGDSGTSGVGTDGGADALLADGGADVPVAPPDDVVAADAPGDAAPGADLGGDGGGGGLDVGPRPDVPVGPCPAGRPCDDGDDCTFDDRCDGQGGCAGQSYACDDGRSCTDDVCDGFGDCRFVIRDGQCLVDGHCLEDGASLAGNACVRCDAAADQTAWTAADGEGLCDDGDPCTGADRCEAGACVPGDGPPECEDDDTPCTEVACTPGTGCTQVPVGGICDDGDVCTGPGLCVDGACQRGAPVDCNDANPCTADTCTPGVGCGHTPIAAECDDGDACTLDDACIDGHCIGGFLTVECHDGDPCTFDWCEPESGECLFTSEGNTNYCEDGTRCTIGDRCRAGVCEPGAPLDCDDGNDCTADSCRNENPLPCFNQPLTGGCCENGQNICDDGNPCTDDLCVDGGSCANINNSAACDDFDACTSNDTCFEGACVGVERDCNDDNECTADSCSSTAGCSHAPLVGPCDDENVCTSNDRCQFGQCTGNFIDCRDTNPCTDDVCDPVAGCQNPFNTAPCEDGDICTAPDACRNGVCLGPPNACDDGDPCTNDACVNPIGCTHQPASGAACDDGIDCTTPDRCVNGACIGDESACVCQPLEGPAVVITSLAIGANGQPGNGLDLDANPNTCSPPGQCSGGINNSMAGLAGIANPEIEDALAEGSFFLLMQHIGFNPNNQPYDLAPWPAEVTVEGCAYQTSTCDFLLNPSGFTEDCGPLVALTNARVSGTTFTAGGVGHNFVFNLPLLEGVELNLVLYNATLQGTVTVQGGRVTQMSGLLGGAVQKQLICDAVMAIDPESLPIPPATICSLVNTIIREDIDTDGNGTLDAASIGLLFEAREARIVGTELD